MIQITNTDVHGWTAAIRGMRNPMNSWENSDSLEQFRVDMHGVQLGPNDLSLMKRLVAAGTDHSKFMRFIVVTCDIVTPMYWWKEFDTYKVGTVRNSCSTMHKVTAKRFEPDDFSFEHLDTFEETLETGDTVVYPTYHWLKTTINQLNWARSRFLQTKDKKYWWQIIQLLPTNYNQKSTVQLNYAVLRNMYFARRAHKLDEWHDFCAWIEQLPYSELITGEKVDKLYRDALDGIKTYGGEDK